MALIEMKMVTCHPISDGKKYLNKYCSSAEILVRWYVWKVSFCVEYSKP